MKISYYTIDDMRLGHDPKGITGWRIRHFLSLEKNCGVKGYFS